MDVNTCLATTGYIRNLALYSHLLPIGATLVLGIFAYLRASNRHKASLFFAFTLVFSFWLFFDLLNWMVNDYQIVAATWAPLDYINIVFFLVLFAFLYTDLSPFPMPWWVSSGLLLLAVVPFVITITGHAVTDFNLPQCEMGDNDFLANYKLAVEGLIVIATLALGVYRVIRSWANRPECIRIVLTAGSMILFMGIFGGAEYLSTLTSVYETTLYSLFSLPIFILMLTIAITSYGTFRLGDSAVKVLFYIFLLLGVSELFFVTGLTDLILTALGVLITVAFGALLLRSTEREIAARHQVEKLAVDLETANARLKELDQMKNEFLSIASHQLRAPITAIKGYASNIIEESYGPVPVSLVQPLSVIQESARLMVNSIEDYLNISRIEQGRMKYEKSDFDMGKLAAQVTNELQPVAAVKRLTLAYQGADGIMVNADIGKVKQVMTNLIDNAIKYTEHGTVSVSVARKDAKAVFMTNDTGIGIAPEEIGQLFSKFTRARGANKVNTTGTGLGLYVAKQLTEGNGGAIRVESDGLGKGSRFIVELPAK